MKKIMVTTASLLLGFTAYSQQSRSNPALDSLMNIKDPLTLRHKLKTLGSGSEADFGLLLSYYRGSEKSSDSIAQLAIRKFPKGQIALGLKLRAVGTEQDPTVQERLLGKLKSDFPKGNFEQMNFALAYNFAKAKNSGKASQYLAVLKGRSRSIAMGTIPGMIMDFDPKVAESIVVQEMATAGLTNEDRMTLLNIHSQILSKMGEDQKAFAAIKEYYEHTTKKSPELSAYYFYLLSKSGDYQTAFPELEKATTEGLADAKLKEELKKSFAKLNPGKDADAYLLSINRRLEEKLKNEMRSQMVNERSPNFKVTDVNGKIVSLTDFKGKTIVLDFWATWCGPCKRSLPAMQMAVDKYKDDPNVKFLFIHTWESVPNPQADAMKYLADNKFNLPLYMDLRDVKTEKNPAVSLFGVDGIPAKFVIDTEGHIRFKMSGFGGTNEVAVAELSAMIELSR